MRRQRKHIYERSDLAHVDPASGLHRIGVKNCVWCILANYSCNITHWRDRSHFVVHRHHRNNSDGLVFGCFFKHALQVEKIYRTNVVHTNNYATNMLDTMQNCVVLGCRAHCYTAKAAHCAQDGGVIALGAAAIEHHFSWQAAKCLRHNIASLVEGLARFAGETVRTRWVCIQIVEKRCHCLNRLMAHGR